jgi:hypothetical protein
MVVCFVVFVYVQGLCVWWRPLRLVMYRCCFFLNDIAVLLLLFKKIDIYDQTPTRQQYFSSQHQPPAACQLTR